jgi:UDP-2-acetamido-3-amino-2,3-dideoxy-glucuronate N-acetyltransferase
LVQNFAELSALAGICDAGPFAEASCREKYPRIDFFRDYSDVLSDRDIQAVVLATPAVTHHSLARRALKAGKDVLVEEPLALTASEGAELRDLAEQRGRILMVGHILRYHPAVRRLKELIQSGALGQLQYLYSNRLNTGKARSEENILGSFAPHDISVTLDLLGEEPAEVACEGGCFLNRIAGVTLSQFLFPSGVRAHIFVSWLHPFKEERLVVVGSGKMAVFDDSAADKLMLYPLRDEAKERAPAAVNADGMAVPLEATEPLKEECRHFLECMVSRRQPKTDGAEGVRVLRVLNACRQAMETRKTVVLAVSAPVDASARPYFAHETAIVEEGCEIGAGTKIWQFSHIMQDARIGERCLFAQNCQVAGGVAIGKNVRLQNNVAIYTAAIVEDDVFLGSSCVLANVANPRSPIGPRSFHEKTVLRRGATVGANAIILHGVEVGCYSFIGAGSMVTKDVPDYAVMMGNPPRQRGWMSRRGRRLREPDRDGVLICPETGHRYREVRPGVMRCLDLDEDSRLPKELSTGAIA